MSSRLVGLTVADLDTPALLVDLDALERNIARSAALFGDRGVSWRPHVKGHKVPAIAHLQLRAGAIGVTCAKLGEAEVMVAAGIGSVLIANQVVGPRKATRLADLCRRGEVITAVDSVPNVAELDRAAQDRGVSMPIVVEVDIGMGRCGQPPGQPSVDLSWEVHRRAGLCYLGLMGWEGHVRRLEDPREREAAGRRAAELLVETARLCQRSGLAVQMISCGGTGTHDFSSRVQGVTEIQAGGIVFNDMYYSALGLDHDCALTVLSTVISRPNARRIVVDAGKKAMSSDTAQPWPRGVEHIESMRFSAEHGVITLGQPSAVPAVGDRLEWIAGYGDTTVFLHDEIYGVRGGIVEVAWPILARGKLH